MKEKLQKEENLDCSWNFAENVMGLVIKDKFKWKRNRTGSTGKKKKVTYLDLSKCVASKEDTLPDINTQEFTGAQRNEEYIGDETKDFNRHTDYRHTCYWCSKRKKERVVYRCSTIRHRG